MFTDQKTIISLSTHLSAPNLTLVKSVEFLANALKEVREAALRDVEETFYHLLLRFKDCPARSLKGWSMRISRDGFEVVDTDLGDWLKEGDFCTAAYLHQFTDDDSLSRLLSVILEHRNDLLALLENYVVRDLGFELNQKKNSFLEAIETPPSIYHATILPTLALLDSWDEPLEDESIW